jgi:phosphoglucomutase
MPSLSVVHVVPSMRRNDAPATPDQKRLLRQLSPAQVDATELGGEAIRAILTKAPGNGEPIGGLKVITDEGWFAVRPSGTEDVYKLYAESFRDRRHLERIQAEAQALVTRLFAQAFIPASAIRNDLGNMPP